MQLQSRQILIRQRSAEDVESSVTAHGADVGAKLDERFAGHSAVAEGAAPRPAYRDVLFTLRDDLAASRRHLVAADNEHVENLRKLIEIRNQRNELVGGLYDQLSVSRRTFDDQFKPQNAFVLAAIEAPASRNSDTLIKQANISIRRLRSPELTLPESKVKAIKIEPEPLADELEAEVGRLREKNAELRQVRRVVQKSRKVKNQALEEHDRTFLWTARTLEGYYQLAGEEELGKQIRPSARRPGRRAVEVAGETGGSPGEAGAGDAETSEEAAADAPASEEMTAADAPTADGPSADGLETDAPETGAEPGSETPSS